ncbi:uncharacterized protein LOC113226106 [Hyposmocoma kahamanoa]|uniref:uncharacterized protein LOC113226106 n=1 Tax=Hyposmocoma kahamanoa TaxID=1477025 RepID=UPI000E6D7269|nr:uncharacterized protein LOC113226106 [Hyposmocoma kahamanoa]
MSLKTTEFLQKLCYKRAATVDMTQYGFISDSKVQTVNLLMKPLREKLVMICGQPNGKSRRKSVTKPGTSTCNISCIMPLRIHELIKSRRMQSKNSKRRGR